MRRGEPDVLRAFLEGRGVDPSLAKIWASHARPNIRLIPTTTLDDDNAQPRISKLGGAPDLPVGAHWPSRSAYRFLREGKEYLPQSAWQEAPLTFLAQINLRDIAAAGCDMPLPQSGMLLFFYDAEVQPWGFDPLDAPGSQVLLVGEETAIRRQSNPRGVASKVKQLRFVASQGLPGWEWLARSVRHNSGYGRDAFRAALDKLTDEDCDFVCPIGHTFGGWASELQAPMELECEMVTNGVYAGDASGYADPRMPQFEEKAAEWRLLLQINTDEELDWMWGDGGMLYFWCREADIAQARFQRAWTILQCG